MQQTLHKSCSRCYKNTWHVESNYILQHPKYLLLFVNRFRYTNNVAKDRCSIPIDTTVMLGPLKFSLRATIDHHGPFIHSGYYTASKTGCKNILLQRQQIMFEIIDSKNSSTTYVILYEWIDLWVLDSKRRVGVWSLPWCWHILSILSRASRGISTETCGLGDLFPPDDPVPDQKLCWYIFIFTYANFIRVLLYNVYIHTQGVSFSIGEAAPHHGLFGCFFGCVVPVLNVTFFSLVYHLCFVLW